MKSRLGKVHLGKLIAGCGAAVLVAVLGVVAVQAEEVSSCWSDFDGLTDKKVFPDAYTVRLIDTYDDPALRAAQRDPAYREATAFGGDSAIGGPVWTIANQGPNPVLTDQLGLLTARGGADPGDLAMYEGRNGKRHWMRAANAPAGYFMKNLRALTFVPQPGGTTNVIGADARSGYLQWCQSVPLRPTASADGDSGWVTATTGNGRTVLLVGQPKGAAAGTSAIAYQDVVTGKVTRRWNVQGAWTDVAADGKLVYAAAPGAVAAYRPGVAEPVWRTELPGGAGTVDFASVANGRVLVASRPEAGGPGTLTALDTAGGALWTLDTAEPEGALPTGDLVLVRENRGGADGVAAYRADNGTPVWFTPVPGLKRLADGGTDGTLLYLPGETGPRVLRVADGTAQPTTLTTPADRVFVSGQRVIVQHTASPELAWTIAYTTPSAAGEADTATDPRER
ncbi:PQQ-like beta-propeller repeat protein [Yinghuangia sp. ASG 101]|uniref:PQQ-like beta-propeller repeat protein n=1 Tax=Yinghuangia sp. ASG 101 TaxID=2896848 RepID=UPI001E465FCA|nr:PQQ-like beta-propeller repeat protein [Yinghuangia sp. ASG 101]UGQ09528.1 PQQ-like beta-propeller repeat protein [Yinghuangia sp. ASG 101]